jgi:hypothetical protein
MKSPIQRQIIVLVAVTLLAPAAWAVDDAELGPVGPAFDPSGYTATGLPVGTPEQMGSLTTLFARDNGNAETGGIYFEIENLETETVQVVAWDVNLDDGGSYDLSVWYRQGTYSGFEQSPAGWTLVGTDAGVVSNGVDVPTPIDVGGLDIPAGETYGIAMTLVPIAAIGGFQYTNGTGSNETYNDGTLELRAGSANNVAFATGAVFEPRVWNGTVDYDVTQPVPEATVPMLGGIGTGILLLLLASVAVFLIHRRATAG